MNRLKLSIIGKLLIGSLNPWCNLINLLSILS